MESASGSIKPRSRFGFLSQKHIEIRTRQEARGFRRNTDEDFPRCAANDEGENEHCLITSDKPTEPPNQIPIVRQALANTSKDQSPNVSEDSLVRRRLWSRTTGSLLIRRAEAYAVSDPEAQRTLSRFSFLQPQ